jgi:hypothetical protein
VLLFVDIVGHLEECSIFGIGKEEGFCSNRNIAF